MALSAALLCAGCPEIEQLTYRFDLKAGRGSLTATGIGTSEPPAAARDFAALVNEYVIGTRLNEEHPGWVILDRNLFEQDGRLDGRVEFGFDSPFDAGLYQADKKSGFLWCTGTGTQITQTNGTIVPLYPNCVVFDRKTSLATVTVTTVEPTDEVMSLLPIYRRWDGDPIGASAVLSDLLSDVTVPEVWTRAGLPLAGGTVVFASEDGIEVTHPGDSSAVLQQYADLFRRAGFTLAEQGDDRAIWVAGAERWYVSTTQAGRNALLSVKRKPLE